MLSVWTMIQRELERLTDKSHEDNKLKIKAFIMSMKNKAMEDVSNA